MASHRADTPAAPAPPDPVRHAPDEPHDLAWDGQVADAPGGHLVGRWTCHGCPYAEPRIIPEATLDALGNPLRFRGR